MCRFFFSRDTERGVHTYVPVFRVQKIQNQYERATARSPPLRFFPRAPPILYVSLSGVPLLYVVTRKSVVINKLVKINLNKENIVYTIYVTQDAAHPIRFVKSSLRSVVDAVANLVLLSLETEIAIPTRIRVEDKDSVSIMEVKL